MTGFTPTHQPHYAAGYQAALADVRAAHEQGGPAAVEEWIRNNLQLRPEGSCTHASWEGRS